MYPRIANNMEVAVMTDKPEVDAAEPAHSGANFIRWLAANPVLPGSARSAAELDEQIAREREAWD